MEVPEYLAYDEGCYECGEPSGVIGFFATLQEAEEAIVLAQRHQQDNWQGQHYMHVIDLANPEFSEHSPVRSSAGE